MIIRTLATGFFDLTQVMSVGPFRHWAIKSQDGIHDGLRSNSDVTLPKLGPGDILVELHAASLNYRDVAVLKVPSVFHLLSMSLTAEYSQRSHLNFFQM